MSAMTIVKGVNKVLTGKGDIPTLTDLYPELFPEEEVKEQKMNKSFANFINFANSHNRKFTTKEET